MANATSRRRAGGPHVTGGGVVGRRGVADVGEVAGVVAPRVAERGTVEHGCFPVPPDGQTRRAWRRRQPEARPHELRRAAAPACRSPRSQPRRSAPRRPGTAPRCARRARRGCRRRRRRPTGRPRRVAARRSGRRASGGPPGRRTTRAGRAPGSQDRGCAPSPLGNGSACPVTCPGAPAPRPDERHRLAEHHGVVRHPRGVPRAPHRDRDIPSARPAWRRSSPVPVGRAWWTR